MNESAPTEPKDTTQATPNDAVVKLEEQLIAAKQEAAASYDRFTRTAADLENFRKRTIREKDELRQFATAGLMEDVIPILDNLGLGLAAARQQAEGKSIVDGLVLVLEQLKSTLARHGLKEINPAGQKFDPHFHECISHQPSAEFAEELVTQVMDLCRSVSSVSLDGRRKVESTPWLITLNKIAT